MPAFAAMVSALFGALSVFLAKLFVAKLVVRIAGVAAITACGVALMAAFNMHLAPLVADMFSSPYGQFIGLAFPPIAGTCMATMMALWLAVTTYAVQVRAIKLTSSL